MAKKKTKTTANQPKSLPFRLWGELSLVVLLSLFSSYLFAYGFASGEEKSLHGDVLHSFSYFRDNLHSLNRFGELQWWNPRVQLGFPIYFSSMLGFNGTTPLFASFCLLAWGLGKAGSVIAAYHSWYIAYVFYCVPLIFNIAMYLLARQMFRRRRLMAFVVIMAVFLPAALFNLDGTIWEQASYGILFAAAFLNYIRRRTRISVWLVVLSILVMTVSINHLSLYWNILFAPSFVIVSLIIQKVRISELWRDTVKVMSPLWLCLALLMVVYCILPTTAALSHGKDLLRWSPDSDTYRYEALSHCNPLPFVTISTPGVSYEWGGQPPEQRKCYQLYPARSERLGLNYAYMGLIALPLVLFGAFFGRKRWRFLLFLLFGGVCAAGILSLYSPSFSKILLPSMNHQAGGHYGDSIFVNGGAVLLILLAGLGFDVLTRSVGKLRWWFIALFCGTSAFSLGLFIYVNKNDFIRAHMYGYLLVMAFLFLVVLVWLARAKGRTRNGIAITMLLLLILIDVSTGAFWHVRHHLWRDEEALVEPDANTIGMSARNVAARHGHQLLYIRQSREATTDLARMRSLTLTPPGGSIRVNKQTYNTLDVSVNSPDAATLVWKNSHFDFWKATVNDTPRPVTRIYNAVQAVAVPVGESRVVFRFSPGAVPFLLVSSHLVVFLMACGILVSGIRQRRKI